MLRTLVLVATELEFCSLILNKECIGPFYRDTNLYYRKILHKYLYLALGQKICKILQCPLNSCLCGVLSVWYYIEKRSGILYYCQVFSLSSYISNAIQFILIYYFSFVWQQRKRGKRS